MTRRAQRLVRAAAPLCRRAPARDVPEDELAVDPSVRAEPRARSAAGDERVLRARRMAQARLARSR